MVVEVALARKIQVQMWAIFGLWYKINMDKVELQVELQDDCHSMSTLQSAV